MTLWVLLLVLLQIAGYSCDTTENWPYAVRGETNNVERVLEGSDVVLKCAGRLKNVSANWEYKQCSPIINITLCSEEGAWTSLGLGPSHLRLFAVNTSHQGLYRCRQHATAYIYLLATLRLEVLPNTTDQNDLELPIFLGGLPNSLTVRENSQVVFRCHVYSVTVARVLWVKEDSPGVGIHYSQLWLNPLSVAEAEEVGEAGVLLSRMIIGNVSIEDQGRYYCVAVNTRGFKHKSVYLKVIAVKPEYNLCLLFLLPLGLAVVPAMVWGCFMWRRRARAQRGPRLRMAEHLDTCCVPVEDSDQVL